jgi:hypothetical protein
MGDKFMKNLNMTVTKPGGVNSGKVVSTHAEMVLYMICYMYCHYQRTSRTMTEGRFTLAEVEFLSKQQTNEEVYQEHTENI